MFELLIIDMPDGGGRMDTATVAARLEEARGVDPRARSLICDEVSAAFLASGTVPSFGVKGVDPVDDPYFLCADRYWRRRFQERPTARTAAACARWVFDHVRKEGRGAVTERWALGNGFLDRADTEPGERTAGMAEQAAAGSGGERAALFVTLYQAGKLRANFRFDELHAFLTFSPAAAAVGSLRTEPVYLALQAFAAFGSRALTVDHARELLERAWSAKDRSRHTLEICLHAVAFAAPFDGQGELLRGHAEEAVRVCPDDHGFHARLAAGRHLCGRHDAALESIDTALSLLAAAPPADLAVLQDHYLTRREAIQEGRLRALRDTEQERRWAEQTSANARLERSLQRSSVRAVEVAAIFTAAIAFAVGSLQITLTGTLALSARLWLLTAQGVVLALFAALIVGGTWLITRERGGRRDKEG
ncbi:hypothetical protein GA0115242_13721 [Streptomyces sp. SolWspMP-5a-2]|nr:hypothetical protein GA0115242_13721 [Streptomyces sp. SolWspMP-5a-2]